MAAAARQNEHFVARRRHVCVLELAGLLAGLPHMPMSEPLALAWFVIPSRRCEPRGLVTFQIGMPIPRVHRGGSRVASLGYLALGGLWLDHLDANYRHAAARGPTMQLNPFADGCSRRS
jgi:hypothetical protein